jgi:hypothetical protein
MKPILIVTVLALVAASQAIGQAPPKSIAKGNTPAPAATETVARCTGPDGKAACTAAHVKQLNDGMVTGRRVYKPLEAVKAVSLSGPDGTLKCEQNNGSACTAEQLDALNQVAGQFKCAINYNSSKSNSGNIR